MGKSSYITVLVMTLLVLAIVFWAIPAMQEFLVDSGPRGPHPSVGIPTEADRKRVEPAGKAPDDKSSPNALEVVITDALTGERIERGCTVLLRSVDTGATVSAQVDGGQISFAAIPPGRVLHVEVERLGYTRLVQPFTAWPHPGQTLHLKLTPRTLVGVVAEAAPGCAIAPRVLFFRADLPDSDHGASNWIWAERGAMLDTPGTWQVFVPEIPEAEFEAARRSIAPWEVHPGQPFPWPGTVHTFEAQGLPVRLELRPELRATGHVVSGELRGPTGLPGSHRRVLAVRTVGPLRYVVAETATDEGGRYALPLPTGNYVLLFDDLYSPQQEAVPISLHDPQSQQVRVPVQYRPYPLEYAEGAPAGQVLANLMRVSGAGLLTTVTLSSRQFDLWGYAIASGVLLFPEVPPGEYRIRRHYSELGMRVHIAPGQPVAIALDGHASMPRRPGSEPEDVRPRDAHDRPIGDVKLKLPEPSPSRSPDTPPPPIAITAHPIEPSRPSHHPMPGNAAIRSIEVRGAAADSERLWESVISVRRGNRVLRWCIGVTHGMNPANPDTAVRIMAERKGGKLYLHCHNLPADDQVVLISIPGFKPARPVDGFVTPEPTE